MPTVDLARELTQMEPGERRHGMIPVGGLASGNHIGIPYTLVRGAEAHPCLWLNGSVHGHESPGSAALVYFLATIEGRDLQGSLIITPVANPTALDARQKVSPIDLIDLDENFPGRDLLHTDITAKVLFESAAPAADGIVSVHTNGTPMDAGIYTVYKESNLTGTEEDHLVHLMAAFQPMMMCRMAASNKGEVVRSLEGAIDAQMLLRGRPGFMVEFGGGGVWEERVMNAAIEGLIELASRFGILPGQNVTSKPHLRVLDRAHVISPMGGFFRPMAKPGQVLTAGTPAGEIRDVHGSIVHTMSFEQDVVVIAMRKEPTVHVGDRIGFVGLAWDEVTA